MRIDLRGAIVPDGEQWIYDWYGIPAVSPKRIMQQIDKAISSNEKELIVNINSPGGSVYAASEIWTHIKKFSGDSVAEITGVCASAASIIAMATKRTVIAPVGALMIHNASTIAQGDYREMEAMKQLLIKTNEAIMQTYKVKTKKSDDELKQMMDAETWMNAQQAVEHGFVDDIMFTEDVEVVASAQMAQDFGSNGLLPKAVIDKMRKLLARDPNLVVNNNVSLTSEQLAVEGEEQQMDVKELESKHPDLVEQIRNNAKEDAIAAERQRIQEIENIALPGFEEIVNKAKFETGMTAAETALQLLNAQTQQRTTKLVNIQQDASLLNGIEGQDAPTNNDDNEIDALVNKVLGNGVK